jgi:hypothetical protein
MSTEEFIKYWEIRAVQLSREINAIKWLYHFNDDLRMEITK